MQKKIGENVSSKVGLTLKERGRRGLALNFSLTHFNAHFDSYDKIRVNSSVSLPPPPLPPSEGNHSPLRLGGVRLEKGSSRWLMISGYLYFSQLLLLTLSHSELTAMVGFVYFHSIFRVNHCGVNHQLCCCWWFAVRLRHLVHTAHVNSRPAS